MQSVKSVRRVFNGFFWKDTRSPGTSAVVVANFLTSFQLFVALQRDLVFTGSSCFCLFVLGGDLVKLLVQNMLWG